MSEASKRNTVASYDAASIAMHWLMLVLFAIAYAAMELKSFAGRGSPLRDNLLLTHYLTGLTVLLLVWLRIGIRARKTAPAIVPPPPAWQASLGRATHWALYLLMIGLPMLGWLTVSAAGKPIAILGISVPLLLAKNVELARFLKNLHETLANAGYFVIGLHAVAALFHHYFLRDNTLTRMLPARFRPATPAG